MLTSESTLPLTTVSGRLTLDEWQSYVEGHPDSSPFHHRSWLELLTQQYRFQPYIIGVKSGNEIIAAIPFLKVNGWREPKHSQIAGQGLV